MDEEIRNQGIYSIQFDTSKNNGKITGLQE